jgi:high mobility group protein B2
MNKTKSKSKTSASRSKSKSKTDVRGRSKSKSSKTKVSKPKHEGPRGKKNAYMWFAGETRDEIKSKLIAKAKNEDDVTGKMVTAELSKQYKDLSTKDRARFDKMAEEDAVRFEKQTADWESKGYWVDEDGKKQTVVEKSGKKPTRSASKSKRSASKPKSKKKDGKKRNSSSSKK